MFAQKINLLDEIDFNWSLKKRVVVSWEEMYERLARFKRKNGHTRVPVQWKQDPKLGKWASRMRYQKMNMSRERVDLLNRINFDWGNKNITVQQDRKNA